MTLSVIQVCALIGLIIMAGLLFWGGYIMGRSDGLESGLQDGIAIQRAENARDLREMNDSLLFIRAERTRLTHYCKRLELAMAFGWNEHQTLLEIGEKLRIAAETFRAFHTCQKLEGETRALRDQALEMAEQLAPFGQENAA